MKYVPRGKAIWNANGGFVSVVSSTDALVIIIIIIITLNRVTLQLQNRNKTANINVKKLWFIHDLTAHYTSKTAKITKRCYYSTAH